MSRIYRTNNNLIKFIIISFLNCGSMQGDHSPGKPGKVREFQGGQEKVRGGEIC